MYANADNLDPRDFSVPYDRLEEIDKWLLSKYNKLVKNVTDSMEEYDLNRACKEINVFLNEDLSNWYIRRNRRRFWASVLDDNKKAVYQTTYEVLVGITKLMAPIVPFVTDEIYRNLTDEESVHLADYPVSDESKYNEVIEEKMDLVRNLISLGRNAREEAKIKVRQPISEVIIDAKNYDIVGEMTNLIEEELNVKNVVFENDLSQYMNFIVKPNFKEVGKLLGSRIKLFQDVLTKLTLDDVNKLRNGLEVVVKLSDEDFVVNNLMVDIRVESKEGFNASYEGNNFIILNTVLSKELINEGLARETVSKIQQIRKNNGFDVADRVRVLYESDDKYTEDINEFVEFVKEETLALEFVKATNLDDVYEVNDYKVFFKVEKI